MRKLIKCLTLFACAFPALAQESIGLKLQSKSLLQSAFTAPYLAQALPAAPASVLSAPNSLDREPIPGSCSVSNSTICYDYRTGRAIYKPARELMPEIAGLHRESLTLKRDKVTLNYSFR